MSPLVDSVNSSFFSLSSSIPSMASSCSVPSASRYDAVYVASPDIAAAASAGLLTRVIIAVAKPPRTPLRLYWIVAAATAIAPRCASHFARSSTMPPPCVVTASGLASRCLKSATVAWPMASSGAVAVASREAASSCSCSGASSI